MTGTFRYACSLVAAVAASLTVTQAHARPLGKFGWFADMVGACWVGTYTAQFDQFIRGTAALAVDGMDKFSGDSVFAWDEKEKRIVFYIWGSDGSHSTHEARYIGEELPFPIRSAYRSVWRRIDAESLEVRREVPDGSGWKTQLTVVYRKVAR